MSMRTGVIALSFVALALGGVRGTAFAHHSVSAEFDGNKRARLSGTVTKVEWMNPHTFFYVDVKDPKTGKVVNWACELGSPNGLVALGWTPSTLKVGMAVSLTGTVARDGSYKVNARNIIV